MEQEQQQGRCDVPPREPRLRVAQEGAGKDLSGPRAQPALV